MATSNGTKILIAIAVIAVAAYATVSTGSESTQSLSSQQVEKVRITGSNLGLRIVGANSSNSQIQLETSDARGCSLTAEATHIEDGSLGIHFKRRGSWLLGWCDPSAVLRLPRPMDVSVEMDKLAGDFVGQFGEFSVSAEKSVIYFKGDVSSFELDGEMAAVYLKFSADVPKENIRINVEKLISNVGVMRGWRHATDILREIF